jgi:hypothetical protein
MRLKVFDQMLFFARSWCWLITIFVTETQQQQQQQQGNIT